MNTPILSNITNAMSSLKDFHAKMRVQVMPAVTQYALTTVHLALADSLPMQIHAINHLYMDFAEINTVERNLLMQLNMPCNHQYTMPPYLYLDKKTSHLGLMMGNSTMMCRDTLVKVAGDDGGDGNMEQWVRDLGFLGAGDAQYFYHALPPEDYAWLFHIVASLPYTRYVQVRAHIPALMQAMQVPRPIKVGVFTGPAKSAVPAPSKPYDEKFTKRHLAALRAALREVAGRDIGAARILSIPIARAVAHSYDPPISRRCPSVIACSASGIPFDELDRVLHYHYEPKN